jgi:hypothetical protein
MAYETSLLFNLLAQKRARNAQEKQAAQGYQQQMMRDVGAFRDKQAAEEEAQVRQAAQLGSLYQDAGEVMPEFNPSFSPQMEGRLKEAAQMGSLAQIGARIKAQRAAAAAAAAEKAKQGYMTERETGLANIRQAGVLGAADRGAASRIRVAEIMAGRPLAARGGGQRDPEKQDDDLLQAKHWSDVAGRVAGGMDPKMHVAIESLAKLYREAARAGDEATADGLRLEAARIERALRYAADPQTAQAFEPPGR